MSDAAASRAPLSVLWVLHGALERDRGRLTSRLASARYRALIPARHLAAHGIHSEFLCLGESAPPARCPRADVVVLSKSFDAEAIAVAESARAQGSALIADFCDDHFDHPRLGACHRRLAALADRVTAATAAMAETVAARTGRAATLVDDPYEGPAGAPAFAPAPERVKLLWFGGLTNLDSVLMMMAALVPFAAERALDLHLVTAPAPELVAACAEWHRKLAPRIALRLTPWSLDATWAALAAADLVAIPTDRHLAGGPGRTVKSPNRMVEALRAGRFPLAHPIPAYQELGAYGWVDDDLIMGLGWALAHPEAVRARIAAGQAAIAARFAPEVVARSWAAALRGAAAARRGSDRTAAEPALSGATP